ELGEDWAVCQLDFAGAFRNLPVDRSESKYLSIQLLSPDDKLVAARHLRYPFGLRSSPLWWGRVAGALVRIFNWLTKAYRRTRSLSLKVARKLLGRLNWYAQLAPYLRSYTSGINSAISYMESSGRRSVTVGRSICADLNLWKVRIESLQCVVLPLPFDDPVVSGSDASTRGLGGWVSVPSEGRHPSVFFFQCGIQDIPSGILEFLVEDPAAGARPSDMACLEMLA
ncbi:hypothetical protein FOZ61_003660, partial [Perkinsus olseni]